MRGEQMTSEQGGKLLQAPLLFVRVEQGNIQVGTCPHCTLAERGRPARAWDARGDDSELDFDRDTLLAHLAALGVVVTSKEEYICP